MWVKVLMERWWGDNDRGKPRYWDKGCPNLNFVYHKFHIEGPGIGTKVSLEKGRRLTD